MITWPNEAYDYLQDNNLMTRIIRYVINRHKIRQSVWLKPWLETQVEDAKTDRLFQEFVQSKLSTLIGSGKYDDIMSRILSICMNRKGTLTYVGDQKEWDTPEYWQTYSETFRKRTGDCEDGAIFMYVMARAAGVPSNRLLLMCGDVTGGGHCWLAYRPERDPLNFRFMDWCWYATSQRMYSRPSFAIVGNIISGADKSYIKLWWCFNETNTYGSLKRTVKRNK